ncbi:MAG: glutaredoxin family protein [Methylophilus sp.]|uniref:glutaredoxin family protein n=1 Tax=Methylophilus sp. TaxID=29541 RepID=UPI002C895375|nr:glutaredoxin family protein [Methylophilus sp.]HSH87973.1 glutaredoxin family protein [Methylophilus sp.]
MQKQLILYGTLGCHLCEDAERVLQSLALPYKTIDIIEDNRLLEKFATSIPVLEGAGQAYLYWPFSKTQVITWLKLQR